MHLIRALIVFQNFDYFIKPSGLPFGYHDAVVSSHADWYKQHPIRNSQDILIINFIWWYERKSHKVNAYYYTSLYMNVFYRIIYYSQMSLDNNWCIQLQP